jgi:hypothetical protein
VPPELSISRIGSDHKFRLTFNQNMVAPASPFSMDIYKRILRLQVVASDKSSRFAESVPVTRRLLDKPEGAEADKLGFNWTVVAHDSRQIEV